MSAGVDGSVHLVFRQGEQFPIVITVPDDDGLPLDVDECSLQFRLGTLAEPGGKFGDAIEMGIDAGECSVLLTDTFTKSFEPGTDYSFVARAKVNGELILDLLDGNCTVKRDYFT